MEGGALAIIGAFGVEAIGIGGGAVCPEMRAGAREGAVTVGAEKDPIGGGARLGTEEAAGAGEGVSGANCPTEGGLKLMVGRTCGTRDSRVFARCERAGTLSAEARQRALVTRITCTMASRQRTPRATAFARPRSALRMEEA